jgi:integrase
MSLYRRKGSSVWWADITSASGRRTRCSTGTSNKLEAKEFHDRLKSEAWRVEKLGERPKHSWDDGALRFLKESASKASYRDLARQIRFWTKHLRGLPLSGITRQHAADLIEAHSDNPATRNRYIACLRVVLNKAAGPWEWIDKAPKLQTYSEPKVRIRWITQEDAAKLLEALPAWMRPLARFALATGLRQANVLGLKWSQVDLERRVAWVNAEDAKARRAIGVPLDEDAVKVVRSQLGKHLTHVFVGHDAKAMQSWTSAARRGWSSACKKAGIADFRFHDLRHTWASWHVQNGTPLYALKELGGWQTVDMVNRYAHLAPEHLSVYAERLASKSASHLRHSGAEPEQSKVA